MSCGKILAVTAAAILLTGCGGNFESIFRTTKSENFNATFIDAKQRGVLVTKAKAFKNWNGFNRTVEEVRACAEPSPDVLASVAASFAASGSVPEQVAAQFASSVTGTAASIGLRTQSIQLMRDALYRVCEAYAAGAIDGFQMRTLQIRYQNMIVGLLAIEQLTGAVRGPTATTGGAGAAGTASDAVAISKQIDAVAARRTALNATLTTQKTAETAATADRDTAKAAVDAAGDDATQAQKTKLQETEDALAKATAARQSTETELADNAKQREALLAALEQSKTASASSSGTATSTAPPLDPETSAKVAEAIRLIVRDVITQDNTLEGCIELIGAFVQGKTLSEKVEQKVLDYCGARLEKDIQLQTKRVEVESMRLQNMTKDPS